MTTNGLCRAASASSTAERRTDMPASPVLMQGNEAVAEGAIAAGARFFAGYPITPSTEIAETLARRMPEVGGSFIQMEDEIASIAADRGDAGDLVLHLDERATDLGHAAGERLGDLRGGRDRVAGEEARTGGNGAFGDGFVTMHED